MGSRFHFSNGGNNLWCMALTIHIFVDIKNLLSGAYEEINCQNIEIIAKGEKGKVEN